jgi:hypothetical protein
MKCLATITGRVAILAAALLVFGPAEARGGGAVSAPSKYAHANRVSDGSTTRTAQRSDFGITEYSSSSARTRSQKH